MADNRLDGNGVIYLLKDIFGRISKKVDKVDGKGLSTNDLTNELKEKILAAGTGNFTGDYNDLTNKPDIPANTSELTNDSNFQTDSQVEAIVTGKNYQTASDVETTLASKDYQTSSDVQAAIAASEKVTKQIVDTLPSASEASENVIYMILKTSGDSDNIYDEYMLINGALEKIGDTAMDLTGYFNTTNLPAMTNAEIDAIIAAVEAGE